MPRILKRPRALTDVVEIWDYIADESEERADAFVSLIDAKIAILSAQPMMGRSRDELTVGLRSFAFGHYVVFYFPLTRGVEIVRVLHGARDIDSLFQEEG